MKLVLTLTFTLLFAFQGAAKSYKGYIITLNGEKVEGQIKQKNVITDQLKITFSGDRYSGTYKPTEIQGYGYEYVGENDFGETVLTWRHYRSKTAISMAPKAFASKEVFMELMEEGAVMLYDYYVETPSDIKNPYKRFFYMERQGTKAWVEVSESNFVAVAKSYFNDHPTLSKEIGQINHRFRHLWKVVRTYNEWKKEEVSTPSYSDTIPF